MMNTPSTSPGSGAGAQPNLYAAHHEPAPTQEGLDAAAPRLQSMSLQRINRKALVFMLGMVMLLLAVIYLALGGNHTRDGGDRHEREERVDVPAAPAHLLRGAAPDPDADLVPAPAPVADIAMVEPPRVLLPPMPEPPLPTDLAGRFAQPLPPSLIERRRGVLTAGDGVLGDVGRGSQAGEEAPFAPAAVQVTRPSSAGRLRNAAHRLLRGTSIRCVLETRINTDVDGYTACVVTEPVYSFTGQHLLLPRGSKVFGQYGSGAVHGDRVAVVWDRIVTPEGVDVSMLSPGVDTLGSAGHPGRRNAHWAQRVSSALLVSLLSDAFKYYGEKAGPSSVTAYPESGAVVQRPFQSNTARALQGLAGQAVRESANRPATVVLDQGSLVNIHVAKDVDFSAVAQP